MRARLRATGLALAAAAAAVALASGLRGCLPASLPRHPGPAPAGGGTGAGALAAPLGLVPAGAWAWSPLPHPATGWEEAAETVALDLRGFLAGRASGGAYQDARAEAARADLALFPPEPGRLRRLLLSASPFERALALAALAARPVASDDLVRIVLRSARPEDEELLRLLAAEVAAALPAELLARHEEELLRAFGREPNPLVLAVALPALERLEAPRLRALLEAQLGLAAPEMVPVLVAMARARLGPDALREAGVLVRERGPREGAGGGE